MSRVNFIHFSTFALFDKYLTEGKISPETIAFIKDINCIWTHGVFYKGLSDMYE